MVHARSSGIETSPTIWVLISVPLKEEIQSSAGHRAKLWFCSTGCGARHLIGRASWALFRARRLGQSTDGRGGGQSAPGRERLCLWWQLAKAEVPVVWTQWHCLISRLIPAEQLFSLAHPLATAGITMAGYWARLDARVSKTYPLLPKAEPTLCSEFLQLSIVTGYGRLPSESCS
jgi:hypothetical protein